MESKAMTALVLGGTGEVGKELVKQLIAHPAYTRILIVGRRPLEDVTSDKIAFSQVDFDNLDQHKSAFVGAQVAYCCLGTTRGKAGKDGFIKVDRDYVVNSAKILRDSNCSHFHLLTSTGSDKNSMMLYAKTKGEAEEQVSSLQFPRLSIYRPGLLLCERKETRLLEAFAQTLAKGFDWRNRFSVHTETVAKAMITNTLCPPSGEAVTTTEGTISEGSAAGQKYIVETVMHSDILRLGID